jgi:hypothetical protein
LEVDVFAKEAEKGRRGGELKEGSPQIKRDSGRASVRPVIVVWNFGDKPVTLGKKGTRECREVCPTSSSPFSLLPSLPHGPSKVQSRSRK